MAMTIAPPVLGALVWFADGVAAAFEVDGFWELLDGAREGVLETERSMPYF